MPDPPAPDAMANLRSKYPQYNDMPDAVLAKKVVEKYPVYKDTLSKYMTSPTPSPNAKAKDANAANIAASLKSQGITESDVRKKGTTAAVEGAKTQHENAQSRAVNDAALKATHDAQVYRMHGGGMGDNKKLQQQEAAAANQSSAKLQGLRKDPGTLLNQIQPHFDETLAQQGGKKGAVYKKAAGLLNSVPDLAALAATEGAFEIPQLAGQSLVTRGFQAQQVGGLAQEAMDSKMRKDDAGQYYTSLFLGGLLAGAPDIVSHAAKGLAKATEKAKPAEAPKAEPKKTEPVKAEAPKSPGVKVGRVTPKEKPPVSPGVKIGRVTPKTPVKPADVPQVKPKVEVKPVEAPKETVPEKASEQPKVVEPDVKKEEAKPNRPEKPDSSKPTYPKSATVKPTGFVQTKIANDYTNQARARMEMQPLADPVRLSNKTITDQVIKDGMHYDAANVARRVMEGGHAMSAHEEMANNLRHHMIEDRLDDLHEAITEGQKRGEDVDAKKIEAEELHAEAELLTDATGRTGTLSGQALQIRKATVDQYSHPQIIKRLQDAVGKDKEVPPEVKTDATAKVVELKKLKKAQAAKEKATSDKSEKQSKDAATESVREMRKGIRQGKKEDLDKELKTHIDRLVKVASQLNAGVDPAIIPIVRDIAVNRLKVASLSAEALVDQVHAIVSEHLPDVSKRDVRDAISGYGQDPQAAKRSQLAEIKTQLRLVSEIEDAKAGVAREQKIAAGRAKASATVQKLRAERDALKNKPAVVAIRMQEMRMKGLQKRLAEVTKKADAGDTSVKPRTPGNASPHELAIRKQIAEKQKVINDLRAKERSAARPPKQPRQPKLKTPAQTRLERLEKQFEQMKAKNAAGDYGQTPKPPAPDTSDEAGMRAKLNAARRERGQMRKAENPAPPKDPYAAYKKAQQKRAAELQRQIDAGVKDMQAKRSPVVRDADAEANKLEIKKKEKELDRLVKSQQPKAFQDRLIAVRRFAALSRVGSLTKLGAAAGERMVFGPLEEVSGLPARYLTPNIERNAPTQGRPSLRAEGGALNKYFSKQTWTKEAVDKFRTGANSIDLKYGGKEDMEGTNDPPSLLNMPGRLHGAIKTPAQMAAFERAQIKGTEWAERQGLDINDPLVQGGVDARAYQESLRAILMQDNVATDLYKSAVTSLQKSSHPAGKATATAMRAFMPIVKVPTNFAGEVGMHLGGAVRAAWEVKVAGGVKNLTPEQSDIVLRSLKKNGVGGMMFAIGYFNADKFGGEYVSGRKRKPGEPEYGAIGSIPHNLLHNPAIEALQIGATWRKVQDDEIRKRASGHPFLRPAEDSVMAIGENLPFLDFPKRAGKAADSGAGMEKFAGEQAASMAIPGFMSEAGALFNKDAQGKQIQRKPQNFWDEIKMAAGFQSTVPTANPSNRAASIPKMNADGSIRQRTPRGLSLPKL